MVGGEKLHRREVRDEILDVFLDLNVVDGVVREVLGLISPEEVEDDVLPLVSVLVGFGTLFKVSNSETKVSIGLGRVTMAVVD